MKKIIMAVEFFCPFHQTRLNCLRGFVKMNGPECARMRDEYHMEHLAMYGSDECGCAWIIYIGLSKDDEGKPIGGIVYIFQSWTFTCSQTREMFNNPHGAKEVHFHEDVLPESNRRNMIIAPDSLIFCPFHHTQLSLMHPWTDQAPEELTRDFGVTHSAFYGSKKCQCIWMAFYGDRKENYGSCHMFEYLPIPFDCFQELPGQPGIYEVVVPEESPHTKAKKK